MKSSYFSAIFIIFWSNTVTEPNIVHLEVLGACNSRNERSRCSVISVKVSSWLWFTRAIIFFRLQMQTGEEWPPPLDRQIIFFQRTISQQKNKINWHEIIFQPLRCPPLKIMLKGSLVLISQIMVMNNKEYGQIFSSKLWKWHCGQNSCFSFQCMFLLFTAKFVANIMLPTRCWQHHSSPKEYLKTGSGVKLLARREGILILLNFWK